MNPTPAHRYPLTLQLQPNPLDPGPILKMEVIREFFLLLSRNKKQKFLFCHVREKFSMRSKKNQ